MMYRVERSPQDSRDGIFLYSAQASFSWPRVDLVVRTSEKILATPLLNFCARKNLIKLAHRIGVEALL